MTAPVQPSLFDTAPTPPYRRNRDTSVAAAKACRESAATMRTKVLNWIAGAGPHGMTVSELMDAMRITERNRIAPRCSDLSSEEYDCVICDSGRRRMGKYTREIVWVLNDGRNAR